MNDIATKQVSEKQLERLAAQRQLYLDAKTILAIHVVLSVPVVLVWSLIARKFPSMMIYATVWGVAIALFDIVIFTPLEESLQKKAAKIQELFDCDVLEIQWNAIKTGERPDPETIINAASRYRKKDTDHAYLIDWYPSNVRQLPINLARLVCQRANCWWDSDLRRRFANILILSVFILTIGLTIYGLVGGFSLNEFILSAVTPLLPSLLLFIRQYIKHRDAAKFLDELKIKVDKYWESGISGRITSNQFKALSRDLQDEIYYNRTKNPIIFEWVYNLLRKGHEDQMNKGADALVEEALDSLKLR